MIENLAYKILDRIRRRRNSILLIFAISMALYLPPLTTLLPCDRINAHSSDSRLLRRLREEGNIPKDEEIEIAHQLALPPQSRSLAPYNLENVLQAVDLFHNTFFIVIYDPEEDTFIAYYSRSHKWVASVAKLINSFKILANSLRLMFPERFKSEKEFVIAISSGDYPAVSMMECIRHDKLPCVSDELNVAPIFHFGSVFTENIVPSMIAMPMPQGNHLSCYHRWTQHGVLCNEYLPRGLSNPNGLVFGDTVGLTWDDLIPSLVWRGTDFSYLTKMKPTLRKPDFEKDVKDKMNRRLEEKESALRAIKKSYNSLIPRWKGVVWTAQAELEARKSEEGSVPWANIKFAGCMHEGQKAKVGDVEYYQQFDAIGIPAVGEGMSLEELARYKYHIDLGGGGM